jgi:squalene-hopene/tetraprenyl-beta-curcumene cyclase
MAAYMEVGREAQEMELEAASCGLASMELRMRQAICRAICRAWSRHHTTMAIAIGLAAVFCFAADPWAPGANADVNGGATWDAKAAAGYLDQRTESWTHGGAMDHGTFCISCHTALPYALARPAMWQALGQKAPSPVETQLLDSVTRRIRLWNSVQPYLGNKGTGPATEAVVNALVLATYQPHDQALSPDTKQAFKLMWASQTMTGENAGSWPWIDADNEPWEAPDSQYWGAALAAVAVGDLPSAYQSKPGIQGNLKLLKDYLQNNEEKQSLLNRLTLLWAAAKLPGLLTTQQKASIVHDVVALQHADGGWSASSLVVQTWRRHDGTPQIAMSDGYATGLAAFAIEQSDMPQAKHAIQAARSWLLHNQDAGEGSWHAYSLNKRRDQKSDVGRFMSDAATAYSVLALTAGR